MVYFCIKEITPLKVEISKVLFDGSNEENENRLINYYGNVIEEKKKNKGNYPPKKGTILNKNKPFPDEKNKNTENNELFTKKRRGTKASKRTTIRSSLKIISSRIKESNDALKNQNEDKKDETEEDKRRQNLDDFELNNLDYYEACEFDKRSFCRTYRSVLMREHLVLMTFFARNDHNLFYIKIEKFLILFCVDMTMNGLFFVHETMHKKYTENEDFTFVQKIPQLLFTLIVSHILEVILCFLSMTDTSFYEIKSLSKYERKNGEKIIEILSRIQRKLNAFFILTFILFLFFWYFISAFCAVYQNTQKIFLRDSMISFAIAFIDPFIIYCATTLLRYISLSKLCYKNCCSGCIFKISDLIPIF